MWPSKTVDVAISCEVCLIFGNAINFSTRKCILCGLVLASELTPAKNNQPQLISQLAASDNSSHYNFGISMATTA